MEDFIRRGMLFDLYGGLLNQNQRAVYEYHVLEDMSFSEIGEEMGITRQAAADLFSRCDKKLEEFDACLKLLSKHERIREIAEEILKNTEDQKLRKLAEEILSGI